MVHGGHIGYNEPVNGFINQLVSVDWMGSHGTTNHWIGFVGKIFTGNPWLFSVGWSSKCSHQSNDSISAAFTMLHPHFANSYLTKGYSVQSLVMIESSFGDSCWSHPHFSGESLWWRYSAVSHSIPARLLHNFWNTTILPLNLNVKNVLWVDPPDTPLLAIEDLHYRPQSELCCQKCLNIWHSKSVSKIRREKFEASKHWSRMVCGNPTLGSHGPLISMIFSE